jgi:hypothetical protein
MPTCKACGAEIRWIETAAGARMCLDSKPEKRYVYHKGLQKWFFLDSFMPHWATCPKAKQFKKPKGD